jgi:hypothetical protein
MGSVFIWIFGTHLPDYTVYLVNYNLYNDLMTSSGSILDEVIEIFNWPNPFSLTMALGSTQPLTGMSTTNLPGGKGRPAHKADNLTAISESIVYKMWEPQHLTNLRASTAYYRDGFTFLPL